MTQPVPPAVPPPYPPPPAGFCNRCGGPLPGPVPVCPRCGAALGARRSSGATAIIVVVVAVALAVPCLGILAAIAIPNFIRYQLRSKVSELPVEVRSLVQAEEAQLLSGGRYLALPRMPAAPAGSQKAALTPEEAQQAAALGWLVPAAMYGRYAVAVSDDGRAAAICAESDIDGDGALAVRVAYLPNGDGLAPPAPCTEPIPYEGEPSGEVVERSDPNVF